MAYTNLSTEFDYKDLLTYQNCDKLAENDAYNLFPGGTVMAFYQAAAPAGWLAQALVNDAMVRIVDGAGGASGGTQNFSTSFSSIAHTHPVDSHSHTVASHVHVLDHTTAAAGHNGTATPQILSAGTSGARMYPADTAGSDLVYLLKNYTRSNEGSGNLTDGTAITDSALSNVTIKYVDVVICTKGN